MSKKQKRKQHKPAVRGPQLKLGLGKAKGDLGNGRTPRMRFVEPPGKKHGNPFFACRVPGAVLSAFRRKAKPSANAAVRAFMAKVAGVKLAEVDDGDE